MEAPDTGTTSSDARERGSLDQDFYRCPNNGDLVYRWSDERMVLVPSDVLRELRSLAGPWRHILDLYNRIEDRADATDEQRQRARAAMRTLPRHAQPERFTQIERGAPS